MERGVIQPSFYCNHNKYYKKKIIKIKIKPVYSGKNNCYQIGVWIRNDTQGIGTITFIREDGTFAALGLYPKRKGR